MNTNNTTNNELNNNSNTNNTYEEDITQNTFKEALSELRFPKVWKFIMNFFFLEKYYVFEFARWIHFILQTLWFLVIYKYWYVEVLWNLPWIIAYIIYYIVVRIIFEIFLVAFSINDKLTRICEVVELNKVDKENDTKDKYIKSTSFKI